LSVKEAIRRVNNHLSLLNHHIGMRLSLRDVDLDCLDLIEREGPIRPSALAHRVGLHPATLTGVLDRLERGGWAVRDREKGDRRAVVVRTLRERSPELIRLYAGMNTALDSVCAEYTETELEFLLTFLQQVSDSGRVASEELVDGKPVPAGDDHRPSHGGSHHA
jgi:DNA-binding MarR family transcriptional regulator